jgi:acyl carrier protein
MKKIFKSPFDLVADALGIKSDLLNEKSAMGETLNWDSLNHVVIIGEIEKHYEVTIPDNEIENYEAMKSIINVYNRKSGNISLQKRVIEKLKGFSILKIFFK